MDVEKSLLAPVSPERLWAVLLDPKAMAACVPGMQSVDVISDTEYVALIKVKISFIGAKFKVRTLVTDMRAPEYLKSESVGEDRSVASSLKSVSEVFLTPLGTDQTELRVKVKAELLGRLGTFGLNIMKTKADLMWVEFTRNLLAGLGGSPEGVGPVDAAADRAPLPASSPPVSI